MNARWPLALALVTSLATAPSTPAATGEDPARPTLALALGGGGSRGLAHIGVLRWLDEHRIPVDAIAGTSMGGLIGGAYASGLGPDELEAWIDDVDFVRLFDWNGPYAPRPYRDKWTTRAFPGPLDTGVFGGVPLGIHDGHAVELLIARLTFPVSDRDDFDRLPTPYRAIAVDFVDAEIVTIGDGSLTRALRATMSLPGFFEPVARNGALLIDGGAMRTLPADAARGFGTDEVLAVDVSPTLKDVDDVRGFPDVFLASLTAQVRVNVGAALEDSDRYVRPDVAGFEPGDFDRADTLIQRGYAAMDSADIDLSHLALSESAYAAWKAERAARRPSVDDFVPAFVEVDADDPADRRSVRAAVDDFVDRPLDLDALDAAMDRLAASDRFVAARYERATRDGRDGLRIVTRADARTGTLEAGLRLRATDVDDADLGLRARFTLRDALVREGEWQSDFLVGTRLDLRSELYLPVAGPLFVALDGGYAQRERAVFDRDGRIGSFERRHLEGGFDLGLGHRWSHHELRLGVRAHRTARAEAVGLRAPRDDDGLTARVRWGFDTTDHVSLPRRGVRGELIARRGFERNLTPEDVDQAVGRVAAWLPVGRHAIVARMEAGATFDRNAPFGDRFTLGGPFRLSALPEDRLVGSNFEYGSLGWQHVLGSPNNFLTAALLFAYETGAVRGIDAAADFEHVGSVNLLVDTPVGNLMTGIAAGDDGARGILTFGIVPY